MFFKVITLSIFKWWNMTKEETTATWQSWLLDAIHKIRYQKQRPNVERISAWWASPLRTNLENNNKAAIDENVVSDELGLVPFCLEIFNAEGVQFVRSCDIKRERDPADRDGSVKHPRQSIIVTNESLTKRTLTNPSPGD